MAFYASERSIVGDLAEELTDTLVTGSEAGSGSIFCHVLLHMRTVVRSATGAQLTFV